MSDVLNNTSDLAGIRDRDPARSRVYKAISWVLLAVGVLLTFYVAASYFHTYSAQRALAAQWDRQNMAAPSVDLAADDANDAITRLSIPKIKLDALVVEGTTHKALLAGPGHLSDTPQPGTSGNSVLAAHRDTFFRNLNDLVAGDDIFIRRARHEYHYVVTSKAIVPPTDTSVLRHSSHSRITLITCYPPYFIGPAPKRLAVQADPAPVSAAR